MTDRIGWALDERDAAYAALDDGDVASARSRARGALAGLDRAGDGVGAERASVLLALGEIEEAAGDLAGALRCLEAAAALVSPAPSWPASPSTPAPAPRSSSASSASAASPPPAAAASPATSRREPT